MIVLVPVTGAKTYKNNLHPTLILVLTSVRTNDNIYVRAKVR